MRQIELGVLICTLILAVGILLAVMPVKLRFFYRWGMDEHSITLRFEFLWRKLGFGIKIYFGSEKIREKYRFIIPFQIGGKEQHHEPRSLEDLFRIFSRYQKLLRYNRVFMERSVCRSFIWETELGFTDYALTGVATGLLWSGKGVVMGYLSRFLKMSSQNTRVYVAPFFGRMHWKTSVNCIFTTRLGHIIIVFSYYLLWLIKNVWDKKER